MGCQKVQNIDSGAPNTAVEPKIVGFKRVDL